MNIFGFEIKSKEEREQEEREYLHRIFSGRHSPEGGCGAAA